MRRVHLDGAHYRIAERGKADPSRCSLIFIHGFSADLSSWCPIAKYFDARLDHMVAIDLPGHGHSQIADNENFDLYPLTCRVVAILERSGVVDDGQALHVIGQSMGGAIAGLFAAQWPQRVQLVTMICPVVDSGADSEFSLRARDGDFSWLVPKSLEQLRAMLQHVSHRPVRVPTKILQGLLEHRLERSEFYLARKC